MSRLDSFIRRLEAQRQCLNHCAGLIAEVDGPILEVGLGNGRTFDHLREIFPSREIFVFEMKADGVEAGALVDALLQAVETAVEPGDELFVEPGHGRLQERREEEAQSDVLINLLHASRGQRQVDAKGFEDVGAAAARVERPIPVLGHRHTCS